jgi:hypothetical protein
MRADYCPVAGEPCQSLCDQPCDAKRHESELQKALDFLCGLHPEVTADRPMVIAQQIFDHVQSELAERARSLENALQNLEDRNALIATLRRPTAAQTRD